MTFGMCICQVEPYFCTNLGVAAELVLCNQATYRLLTCTSAYTFNADSTKTSMSLSNVQPLTSPMLTLHLHSQALSAPLPAVALSFTISLYSPYVHKLYTHPRYSQLKLQIGHLLNMLPCIHTYMQTLALLQMYSLVLCKHRHITV